MKILLLKSPEGRKQLSGELMTSSFVRYMITGVTTAVMEMGLLIWLVESRDVPYLISNGITFIIVNIFNYIVSRYWVFEKSGVRKRKEFPIFMAFVTVGLAVSQLVLWIGVGGLGLDYRISKVISIAFVVAWNFFTRKHFIFNSTGAVAAWATRKE